MFIWLQTVQILNHHPTPPLYANIYPQIIYFPSILSLVFVLSRAKLKETNEEIGLFSSFTQRKLEWVAYNTQDPKFLPLTEKKKQTKQNSTKFSNLESLIFYVFSGGIFHGGTFFWVVFSEMGVIFWEVNTGHQGRRRGLDLYPSVSFSEDPLPKNFPMHKAYPTYHSNVNISSSTLIISFKHWL